MNAKSKAFAFISVALMISGALFCCFLTTENSSALNIDFDPGTSQQPLSSLICNVWDCSSVMNSNYPRPVVDVYLYQGSYIEIWEDQEPIGEGDWFGLSSISSSGLNFTMTSSEDKNKWTAYADTVGDHTLTFEWTDRWEGDDDWETDYEACRVVIHVIQSYKTVTFNSMGGSAVSSQSVSPGGYATIPANPTNGVKVFGGWFTDQACTQAFNFSTPINNNITLYAKWTDPTASITSTHGNSSMTVGQLFSYDVSTNPTNAAVSVSGASWLNVSGHTVYGTPTSPGTYNVTITSSASGYNSGSQSFTITVSSVLAPGNTPSNGVIAYVR